MKTIFDSKIFELRKTQCKIVEIMARYYLSQVQVELNNLSREEHLCLLIGAAMAVENAIIMGEYVGDIVDRDFGEQLLGILKNTVQLEVYHGVRSWIEIHTTDDASMAVRRKFVNNAGYTQFEAYIRALSMAVSCYILPDEYYAEGVAEALYCLFLKAKSGYVSEEDK